MLTPLPTAELSRVGISPGGGEEGAERADETRIVWIEAGFK
jgi:hypothetical protein